MGTRLRKHCGSLWIEMRFRRVGAWAERVSRGHCKHIYFLHDFVSGLPGQGDCSFDSLSSQSCIYPLKASLVELLTVEI